MLAEGKIDSVLDQAQILTKKYTHSFSLWNLLGASFYRNEQLIESIACYQRALKIKPDFPQAFNNMANALLNIGDLDSAITHYKKAIKIKPNYSNAFANLGSALTQKKDYKNAVVHLEKAIEIDPKNAENYNKIALAQLSNGDLEGAIRSFKTVIKIDPHNMKAQHLLAASTGVNTDAAPKKYVEGLFDYYAANFESSLLQKLQYTVPETITNLAISNNSNDSLGSILDLGCGTGLLGPYLKQSCTWLEGIDLSQKMLNQARSKNMYDNLIHADILEYL
jgi:predicted TPR repeat methyltransferase